MAGHLRELIWSFLLASAEKEDKAYAVIRKFHMQGITILLQLKMKS